MTRPVRHALLLVVALGLLAVPTLSASQPSLVLYDNFAGKGINPAKWRGNEFQPGNNQELSRMIVKGQAQFFLISWGSEADNTGFSGFGAAGLHHPNPDAVTAMQALVTVVQGTAQGCPDNDTNAGGATVRAEIRGVFFNDGSGTPPNDQTGDVIGRIEKRLNDFGQMAIRMQVVRCTDAPCNGQAQLPGSPFTFAPSWAFGQAHALRLVWDATNHQFVGTVLTSNGQTILDSSAIPYALSDTTPPVAPSKQIRVQAGNSNCTDGATLSAIQALFDNVFVNAN